MGTSDNQGSVIARLDDRFFKLPEAELARFRINLADVVPEILKEVGSPPDLADDALEDQLASWNNPVVGYVPGWETE